MRVYSFMNYSFCRTELRHAAVSLLRVDHELLVGKPRKVGLNEVVLAL